MPVRRVLPTLALAICAALLVAPAAGASWLKPTSRVSGQARITWTATIPTLTGPSTVEGALRFDVVGRATSAADAAAWAPTEISATDDRVSRFFGFLVRSRVTVERYTVNQPGRACGDGQVPSTTTSAAGGPVNAMLDTFEPVLDLVRRRGTVDVGLAATGAVPVTTTGTGCATPSDGVLTVPVAREPFTDEARIADMLGENLMRQLKPLEAVPLTIATDRSFAVRTSRKLNVDTPAERSAATVAFDLRVAGPPAAQSGNCVVPTTAEVRRLRTAADVQRLARRRGFSRIAVGAPRVRGSFDRGARYRLEWGGVRYPCGQSLGSRRAAALFPLKRAP